ncbi:hypothetical protein NPIL_29271 [Nephila pilipes]|uniref:Uncharacterized protein n=1 Tax=Nephila pilipes TaxID=299642 RepID=A0A8X6R5F5_NEPPI|nr:hypothetical protein NPIL_29271 [Nephila pilipes]
MLNTERDMFQTERDELLTENARLRRALRSLAQMISDPCSSEPRAASPRSSPSMAKPTFAQRGTHPPIHKRSRSKEEKKSSKWNRTDEGKSSRRHTSPDARPYNPRSQHATPHDPRSEEVRPRDFKIHPRHIAFFGRCFLPSSREEPRPQICFHHHGMVVFISLDDGFTLTNGAVSYALDQWCANTLSKCLTFINIGTVCVIDARSKVQFRAFQNSLPTLSPWQRLTIVTLNHLKEDMGPCPYCYRNECHRWLATQGMSTLPHFSIYPIHHT